MSISAKNILIKGEVQGVFFRKNTKDHADKLNLKGWVKNADNGDVEIFVQGEETAVEALINWCWQGSPKAQVDNVEVKDAKEDDSLKDFLIDR